MAVELVLRFVDSSYKECEVTGRDMGGDDLFEIPLSSLKCGVVDWAQKYIPNHSVHIQEVGSDYVVAHVTTVSRSVLGPKTIHIGEKWNCNYMFGEWSYGFTLTLVEKNR